MIAALVLLSLLAQQPPVPGAAPPAQTAAPAPDPASVTFATDVGLLLVAIKPDRTADYELALVTLQELLAKQTDPARRALAQGWRVYKASEADAKGNVLYIHALLPAVAGADYRPSRILDELLQEIPADAMARYRDAFATPPTKLSLTEFANMAVAPVKK